MIDDVSRTSHDAQSRDRGFAGVANPGRVVSWQDCCLISWPYASGLVFRTVLAYKL